MAKLLKLRRGTTTQHGSFTGAEGEVTIDTTKDTAVVHDGSQAGGRPLAREDMSNVPAGTILGTQLENSGVTAGQYGSSSAIPIVTVDAQGLVTAASTTAIDSTTIANGTSSVAVANNGNITTTRAGTARHVVDDAGVHITGTLDVSGQTTLNGDLTIGGTYPSINLYDSNNNPDYRVQNTDGMFAIYDQTNGANRIQINTDGHIDLLANVDIGNGIDVTGNITTTGDIKVPDDKSLFVGNSDDFKFTHRSSDNASIISETGAGSLSLESNGSYITFYDSANNETMARFNNNGACEFKHGATTRLATTSSGASVTGDLSVSGTVDGVDVAARDTLFGGLTSSSGVLTTGVTAHTYAATDDSNKVATTAFVKDAITGYVFPSGTKMLFQQSAAPSGWTKITSGVENKALRVTSGTAGSGGTNQFTNTFASVGITANASDTTQSGNVTVANATVTGNVSIDSVSTSGTVNSHTLTSNEMPSHRHNLTRNNSSNYWNSRNNIDGFNGMPQYTWRSAGSQYGGNGGTAFYTDHTGGGGGHSHGFTGSSHTHTGSLSAAAHTHNASFTGSAHNHSISVNNIDLAVQYLDVIVASKD